MSLSRMSNTSIHKHLGYFKHGSRDGNASLLVQMEICQQYMDILHAGCPETGSWLLQTLKSQSEVMSITNLFGRYSLLTQAFCFRVFVLSHKKCVFGVSVEPSSAQKELLTCSSFHQEEYVALMKTDFKKC